jgi:transcriptional regulator with XRE-family HTH domain
LECGPTAQISDYSKRTIVDFERGARSPHASTLFAIQTAFEAAGVTFVEEEDVDGNAKMIGLTYRPEYRA